MFNFLFNSSDNNLRKCNIIVQRINNLESKYKEMPDSALQDQTQQFKQRLNRGESLDDLLIDSFATVREATRRILKIRLFDTQLLGGIILHNGKISEMKTGEGKTLVAVLPAYLNALTETGVHIVTVNDYLARRDSELLGPVYEFLNIKVGLIQEHMDFSERKENYACDITYVTNSQLGFDYLKENMANSLEQVMFKSFSYCIVDEIDSILIDDARTPLIISSSGEVASNKYVISNEVVKQLKKETDYEVDKKNQTITLTDEGLLKCEQYLKVNDIYNVEDPWAPFILNAIKASELYIINRNYITRDNEIIIVDENTGRVMAGRRWSDGLHQAIEAKENLKVQGEAKTLASITYQNFFLLYNKLSGMTGTAKTEEIEFEKIYSLEVISIPTNRPMIRHDLPDLIYKNQGSKWKAIANECYDMSVIERPVLVGTTSVEYSEVLSSLLKNLKIPHNLLNAKPENIARESEIIAQAGRKGTITIATNMAGRGTDIILGGNADSITQLILKSILEQQNLNQDIINEKLKQFKLPYQNITSSEILVNSLLTINHNLIDSKFDMTLLQSYINHLPDKDYFNLSNQKNLSIVETYKILHKKITDHTDEEREKIKDLGGLYVIGTERHASRRIDNQLRGRAGRQGDPGQSRFFLSLDDTLFQRFPVEKIKNILETLQLEDETPIQSPLLTKTLESSQKKIESYYFDQRKNIFDYDQVLNKQRQAVYSERRRILKLNSLNSYVLQYGKSVIIDLIDKYIVSKNERNYDLFLSSIHQILGLSKQINREDIENMSPTFLYSYFYREFVITYRMKMIYIQSILPGTMIELERFYTLLHIDNFWTEHLKNMGNLMDSVGWRSYGQEDPLVEYKYDAFKFFLNMTLNIRQNIIYSLLTLNLLLN
uniref:preprotein translocase subunit SecA n=1 Tax=Erythrolobus coxiae TaxID=362235 RepID=UPI001FCCEB49|nr:preprotein translocase subunit SecA [Erythrolobus coxiae]UNJ17789.1 preprotein translocase subunit SecA [Erythrolobus coxiae]